MKTEITWTTGTGPEWVAKIARRKQAEKEGREYEAHRSMMRRVMGY